MSRVIDEAEADRRLKDKHRTMWTSGDYPAVATQVIAALGPTLLAACPVRRGTRLLDVAAGAGNVAIPAAAAGADVVASDLAPALLETGRLAAERAGLRLDWQEADAEALPWADGAFDVVTSCVGVMFAPHHRAAADELVRVCRSGGTIALLSWTPEGFIGQMFATMRPFVPAPPTGASPPPLWGDDAHVRALLGDRVRDVRAVRDDLDVTRFASPEEFLAFFKACYGPTISAYATLEDPARVRELDAALLDLARRHARPDGSMPWEYLLLTAVRA